MLKQNSSHDFEFMTWTRKSPENTIKQVATSNFEVATSGADWPENAIFRAFWRSFPNDTSMTSFWSRVQLFGEEAPLGDPPTLEAQSTHLGQDLACCWRFLGESPY